jgi:hypothetical protein
MWYGVYALIDNECRQMLDWRAMIGTRTGALSVLSSMEMRAAAVSVLFNKEYITMVNSNAYVTLSMGSIWETTRVDFDEVIEAGYPDSVIIKDVQPYVSGALLFGTVVCDAETTEILRPNNVVETDELGTYDWRSAMILANIYRVYGHDATVIGTISERETRTYASVRECVINTAQIPLMMAKKDRYYLETVKRPGRSCHLPTLMRDRINLKLAYAVTMPVLVFEAAHGRPATLRSSIILPTAKRTLKFNVSGRHVVKQMGLKFKPTLQAQPSFRVENTEITPIVATSGPAMLVAPPAVEVPPAIPAQDAA